MAQRVFLDLECIPPDKNDPAHQEKLASCTEEEYRGLALRGEYARILCIGLIVEDTGGRIIHRGILGRERSTMKFHMDEARTIRAFWRLLGNFDPQRDLIIGFNILDYDLVVLKQRSIRHQIRPTCCIPFTRYRSQPVFDVMWEFESWRHRISLDELARVMGMPSSKQNGVDGSKVYDLFLEGRHQEIADYCLADVELTRMLFRKINFIEEV
ncbi:MAG TPA: ribonuclease H-like domain-containing protein [Pyrinomonadaceae bacterium]|nr:ribonuclease H-like domain-containing protein [Pyrinomonadaceae bacterium]